MKKSVFSVSLLVAGLAFAGTTEVTNDYVLGVMPVSASGKKQVILSIPWVAEGGGVNAIAVTNLVKTAGLAANDTLTWYNTSKGKYQTWKLSSGDTKYWIPQTDVSDENIEDAPTAAALAQGQAIVLTTTASSLPSTLYVVGQVGTRATVSTEVAGNNAWTLLAPPVVSGTDGYVDFNQVASDGSDWASCEGDEITYAAANGTKKSFTCTNVGTSGSPSYKWTGSFFNSVHTAPIPVGQGVWYHRIKGNDVTITWSYVPTVSAE